jgi:hypothetical protein
MRRMRSIRICAATALLAGVVSCATPPKYGQETPLALNTRVHPLWAIAPALNLSGEQVDPLLQADLLYQQLQAVGNVTVVPVNRVVAVYEALGIDKVETEKQAMLVCQQLGCDGLIVPTVTAYDPYNPPKFGVALQLLGRGIAVDQPHIDARLLVRQATPMATETLPSHPQFIQVVGVFDAANGSVHTAVLDYAKGRNDPLGPLGAKEYFVNMDRYCGFAYHALIVDLVHEVESREAGPAVTAATPGNYP